jgi:hypothetical protein
MRTLITIAILLISVSAYPMGIQVISGPTGNVVMTTSGAFIPTANVTMRIDGKTLTVSPATAAHVQRSLASIYGPLKQIPVTVNVTIAP